MPPIQAGAHSYLLKDVPPTELALTVRNAYAGKVQLHPEVARTLMSAAATRPDPPTPTV